MDQDYTFMRLALAQAEMARAAGEVPVGAVVVRGGEVIAVGRNAPIETHDATAHAEVVALRAAAQTLGNYRLDECTLYVTLEPCPMCAGAMLHSRLQRVVYGATDPKTGAAGSVVDLFGQPQLNHQTQIHGGILAEECAATLRSFFKERRQIQTQHAQPLREDGLRTPDSAFVHLARAPLAARYFCDQGSTAGWRLFYEDVGEETAPMTVLCLHDVPGWGYSLSSLTEAFHSLGLRVLVPDLVGFGRSDKPKREALHSPDLHFLSLQGLLRHAQPKGLVIVGVGRSADLARLVASSYEGSSVRVFHLPSLSNDILDMTPYPNKGYQAALKAAPRLLAEIRQVAALSDEVKRADKLEGAPSTIAEQLVKKLHRG